MATAVANATIMRPVEVNLPGRILDEAVPVTVACAGKKKKMTEMVKFVSNATIFNVSEARNDRFKGAYRSVGVNIAPGVTCFMLCYGKNAIAAGKLQEGQLASFRGTIDDGNRGKIMTVRDIITAKVTVS
jgi:hypothetical protein